MSEKYVGGEFIIESDKRGLTIKRNKLGRGEVFEWDDIKHLLKTSDNNKYKTALELYDKWYKSKKPITFIEWCEKRLNQQG